MWRPGRPSVASSTWHVMGLRAMIVQAKCGDRAAIGRQPSTGQPPSGGRPLSPPDALARLVRMDRDLVRRWLREVLQPVRDPHCDAAALTTQYPEQGLIFVDVEAVLDEVPTLLPRTDVYSTCGL